MAKSRCLNKNLARRHCTKQQSPHDDRQNSRCYHWLNAVGEQRHRTCVLYLASVTMEPFVCRWTNFQYSQQHYQRHDQQRTGPLQQDSMAMDGGNKSVHGKNTFLIAESSSGPTRGYHGLGNRWHKANPNTQYFRSSFAQNIRPGSYNRLVVVNPGTSLPPRLMNSA